MTPSRKQPGEAFLKEAFILLAIITFTRTLKHRLRSLRTHGTHFGQPSSLPLPSKTHLDSDIFPGSMQLSNTSLCKVRTSNLVSSTFSRSFLSHLRSFICISCHSWYLVAILRQYKLSKLFIRYHKIRL